MLPLRQPAKQRGKCKRVKTRKTVNALVKKLKEVWFDITIFFRVHWTVVLLIGLLTLIVAYWVRSVLPRTGQQAAQTLLSTEVQSLATLLGIMLVGIAVLWSQAMSEEGRLLEIRPKYYELLRHGLDRKREGTPFIEELRREYLRRIKERKVPRKVFPYDHPTYKTHKDLFLDISRLSDVLHDYYGLTGVSEHAESDLRGLGFSEEEFTDRVLVTWYDLKNDPTEFLELVTDIFNPANTTLYELDAGDFAERVWDVTLNLRTETSLERLKNFKQFRSVWFRIGFGVYVLAIVSGLLAISSTSSDLIWRPWLACSLFLGFIAVVFTVLLVHRLLRSQ
jgi:hypothetical protein